LEWIVRGVLVLGLCSVWAGGLWLRVTSLGTAPKPTSDEAVYGVQGDRLLRGRAIHPWAESGHLLSPFLIAFEAIPALLFKPSFESLRIPAVASGLAAVVACYWVGRRMSDRLTGLIASGLMASSPIAIIYSRLAWEPCLIPLYSLICLAVAYHARPLRLLGVWLLGIALVHPTILMLGPIVLAVSAARQAESSTGDRSERWRAPRKTFLIGLLVILVLASAAFRTGAARWTFATYPFGPSNWGIYFGRLARIFLGSPWVEWRSHGASAQRVFWAAIVIVGAGGSIQLLRRRAWTCLALVGATVSVALALHVALGPDLIRPGFERYVVFLAAPSVLGFAFLVGALLPGSSTLWSRIVRAAMLFLLLGAGVGLLGQARLNWFDLYIAESKGAESVWTLQTESKELNQEILRSLDRSNLEKGRGLIVADDWWHEEMIRYLTQRDPRLRVLALTKANPEKRRHELRRALAAGGRIVGDVGGALPAELAASVPANSLEYQVFRVGWNRPAFVTWTKVAR
jgi:Dolichyl-phosphate-mannose-protein mannosyltransferase